MFYLYVGITDKAIRSSVCAHSNTVQGRSDKNAKRQKSKLT